MRIVFMGTPDIAATCLERLCAAGFAPVGVYTKPDMPKNRGMKLSMSEVKEAALAHGLPVFQPTTFKDDAVVEELRALAPDVIAVVAYGKILPQRVLDIPPLGCINIHASILPELRGAGPVQWAILNGLPETGVTGMYMDAGMDTGDIIEIRRTPRITKKPPWRPCSRRPCAPSTGPAPWRRFTTRSAASTPGPWPPRSWAASGLRSIPPAGRTRTPAKPPARSWA